MVPALAKWNGYSQHSSDLIPCTFLLELLGCTGEKGHGWADLSIQRICFDFMTITIWLVGPADLDSNLNLLFCQFTLLPCRSAYIYKECPWCQPANFKLKYEPFCTTTKLFSNQLYLHEFWWLLWLCNGKLDKKANPLLSCVSISWYVFRIDILYLFRLISQ